jgi:hypothetical protein
MGKKEETMKQILTDLQQQIEISLERLEAVEGSANTTADDVVPNQIRTTLTTAKRVIELQPFIDEKAAQTIDKIGTPRIDFHKAKKIAQYLYELNSDYVMRERSLFLSNIKSEQDLKIIPELETRAKFMEKKLKDVEEWRDKAENLKVERQSLYVWQWRRKKEIDRELELIETKINVAQHSFNSTYHLSLDDTPFEIERIREEIKFKRSELDKRHAREAEIKKELEIIETEYRIQKQIADNHPDRELIYDLLEQMREAPASARKSLHKMQLERRLDTNTNRKNK